MNRKLFAGLALLLALLVSGQAAEARNSQGYWVWETLGGDPRKWGGVHSWEEYRAWFTGPKGIIVEGGRVKLPNHISYRMARPVEQRLWNRSVVFADNSSVKTYKQLVPKGTLIDFLTFNVAGGPAIEKVIMNFSAWAYVVEVTEATGQNWKLYTFQECANAGRRQSLLVVTPPPTPQAPMSPRVTTPFPAEQSPVYNELEVVGAMTAPTVTRHTVSAPGIMGALLGVLGKWLGRPVTNISQSTGPVYGSNATGGAAGAGGTATGGAGGEGGLGGAGGTATNGAVTATTAPITVTQGGQSMQQQVNNPINISNENANNNVTGNNSAGAVNNVNSQTIEPIQQQLQDGD